MPTEEKLDKSRMASKSNLSDKADSNHLQTAEILHTIQDSVLVNSLRRSLQQFYANRRKTR